MNWRDKALGAGYGSPRMQQPREVPAMIAPASDADGWTPVKSGHLDAVKRTADCLFVRFKGGKVYPYPGKQDHFDALVAAESPGAYHAKHLR